MSKFKVQYKNSQIYVKSKLDRSEQINMDEVNLFGAKLIRGLMRPSEVKGNSILYTAPNGILLQSYMQRGVSKNDFYLIVAQLVETTKKLERYGLNINNLLLDARYVFINDMTKEIHMIYQPVLNPSFTPNIFQYLYDVVCQANFQNPSDRYCSQDLINFMNGMPYYASEQLEDYLNRTYPDVYKQIQREKPGQSQHLHSKQWNVPETGNVNGKSGALPFQTPAGQQTAPKFGQTPVMPGFHQTPQMGNAPMSGVDANMPGQSKRPAPPPFVRKGEAPGMNQMPGTSQTPGMNQMPGLNQIPGMHQAQGANQTPEFHQVPGFGQTPSMPGMGQNAAPFQQSEAAREAYEESPTIVSGYYNSYEENETQLFCETETELFAEPETELFAEPETELFSESEDTYVPEENETELFVEEAETQLYQESMQPMCQEPVKPVYQEPVQPAYQESVWPMRQEPVRPVYQESVQPIYQEPVRPIYQEPMRGYQQAAAAQEYDMDDGMSETTLLDEGFEETTLLMEEPKKVPYLIRVSTGERADVNKPVFMIGKMRSAVDFVITNNSAVSRHHADIVTRDGRYYIVDNNSTNRTYINGQMAAPKQETEINHMDKILLGNEELEFYID